MKKLYTIIFGFCLLFSSNAFSNNNEEPQNDYFYQVANPEAFFDRLKMLLPPKAGETNQQLLFRYFKEHKSLISNPAEISFDDKHGELHYRTTEADDKRIKEFIVKLTSGK